MKKFVLTLLSSLVAVCGLTVKADKLVILHTNDTHSQIDPADNGLGGVVRRKALIDSVRAVNQNVLLIDAGDAVQGTMYFTIYKGEVEYSLLDRLGYDIAVLGNHDFDNGLQPLIDNIGKTKVQWLSANYDLTAVPGLDSIFQPGVIKGYGDKKIGIFGINLVPEGMIAKTNCEGVVYMDGYAVADSMARILRDNGADYVIAVTHIGYDTRVDPNDVELAKRTKGIDLIVGGHSHSMVTPDAGENERFHWKHLNAAGDTVRIVQAGSRGAYVGEVTLDLSNGAMDYQILTVDQRLDNNQDTVLLQEISRYRNSVDSIMAMEIGTTARALEKSDGALMNFLGDFVAHKGEQLIEQPVIFSLINSGGVRRDLPKGEISKGMIIEMLPFNNRIEVLEIKGADLLESINHVILRGGNDGVMEGTEITFNPETHECVDVILQGQEIDPDSTYLISTIDYLADGGDYMTALPRATVKARSENVLYDDLIEYVITRWKGKVIDAPSGRRIKAME